MGLTAVQKRFKGPCRQAKPKGIVIQAGKQPLQKFIVLAASLRQICRKVLLILQGYLQGHEKRPFQIDAVVHLGWELLERRRPTVHPSISSPFPAFGLIIAQAAGNVQKMFASSSALPELFSFHSRHPCRESL